MIDLDAPKIFDALLSLNEKNGNSYEFTQIGDDPTNATEYKNRIKFVTGSDQYGDQMYTWTEVKNELASLQTAYDGKDYARNRFSSYPNIHDQLDMLYHDLTNDKLDSTGTWAVAIKKVKDDNPKE